MSVRCKNCGEEFERGPHTCKTDMFGRPLTPTNIDKPEPGAHRPGLFGSCPYGNEDCPKCHPATPAVDGEPEAQRQELHRAMNKAGFVASSNDELDFLLGWVAQKQQEVVRQTNIRQIENWRDWLKPNKDMAWLVQEMDSAIATLKDENLTNEDGVYREALERDLRNHHGVTGMVAQDRANSADLANPPKNNRGEALKEGKNHE